MKGISISIVGLLFAAIVRASAGHDSAVTTPAIRQAPAGPERRGGVAAPALLSETGLYAGVGTTAIDPRNRPFSPQYPLWTDGATKKRWVRLPEGAAIDATNLSRWEFPVGTRFWKEFSFGGRKVETRMLWRVSAERWMFATYVWNEAQTDAELAPETGIANAAEITPADVAQGKPARRHTIPGIADCRSCHDSARTEILGFNALNLSDDRDPNAPHAEPLTREMITLKTLTEEGVLTPSRPELITAPPRVIASTPEARAAIGYLATNCGNCHNRESSIASLGLFLNYDVRRKDECSPALVSTAGKRGHWVVPDAQDESRLINPGNPAASAVIRRVKSRRPSSQMPPLGSVVADKHGADVLTAWVNSNPEQWQALIARCAAGAS